MSLSEATVLAFAGGAVLTGAGQFLAFVISPITPLPRAARVILIGLCCSLIILLLFGQGSLDTKVWLLAAGTTFLVGIMQLFAFIIFPITLFNAVARVAMLLCWCALIFLASLELFVFNYCEANCPSTMNRPTAGIVAAVMALNASVLWLGFRTIPRFVSRGEISKSVD